MSNTGNLILAKPHHDPDFAAEQSKAASWKVYPANSEYGDIGDGLIFQSVLKPDRYIQEEYGYKALFTGRINDPRPGRALAPLIPEVLGMHNDTCTAPSTIVG